MNQTPPKSALGMPTVALVGRPNVGKSTLLNRLCGSRVAIVEPTAGVTRDRVSVPARMDNPDGPRWIEVVDTGGGGICRGATPYGDRKTAEGDVAGAVQGLFFSRISNVATRVSSGGDP